VDRITESEIKTLVVTNTNPLSEKASKCGKIRVGSVSKLLAEAIHRSHTGSSVSSLFV
jgi:ribose-phosphate pyrophosphokinase